MSSNERMERLRFISGRLKQLVEMEMFSKAILIIHQSYDNEVLVYNPIVETAHNRLVRVELYRVDLNILPLRAELVCGNGEKLFRMRISCRKPNAKTPMYDISIPIMPQREIQAVVVNGEVNARTHIGDSKSQIRRVYVDMDWITIAGKRIKPNIRYIELYGVNKDNETVKEHVEAPTIADYMHIINGD